MRTTRNYNREQSTGVFRGCTTEKNVVPHSEWDRPAQLHLAETIIKALPLDNWNGKRNYLMFGDTVGVSFFCPVTGAETTFGCEVTRGVFNGTILPVFMQETPDEIIYHAPHELLINGASLYLVEEANLEDQEDVRAAEAAREEVEEISHDDLKKELGLD